MFKINFYYKLFEVCYGWIVFRRCIREIDWKRRSAFIIMPSHDRSINQIGLKYLKQYLEVNFLETALIVASDLKIKNAQPASGDEISRIKYISKKDMRCLLAYYNACNPGINCIVVDIDRIPVRKNIRNLVGVNGMSLEQVVSDGIYKITKTKKELREMADAERN